MVTFRTPSPSHAETMTATTALPRNPIDQVLEINNRQVEMKAELQEILRRLAP